MSYLSTPSGGGEDLKIGSLVVDGDAGSILYLDQASKITQDTDFVRDLTNVRTFISMKLDEDIGENQFGSFIIADRKTFEALNIVGLQKIDLDTNAQGLFGFADTSTVLGSGGSTVTMFGQGSYVDTVNDIEYGGILLNSGKYATMNLEKIDLATDNILHSIGLELRNEQKAIYLNYINEQSGQEKEIFFGLEAGILTYRDDLNSEVYTLPSTFPTADNQVISVLDYTTGETDWVSLADVAISGDYYDLNNLVFLLNSTSNSIYTSNAGTDAGILTDSFIVGENAGGNILDGGGIIAIGKNSALNGDTINNSIFIGESSGKNTVYTQGAVAIGQFASQDVNEGNYSIYIGAETGSGATTSNNSVFIGQQAGAFAETAPNSIFIGDFAGSYDTVDNTTGSSSILIGQYTSTGGFSNSIAIGQSATNTATNQFMIGSSVNSIVLPASNTPSSASSTGTKGTVCWDTNFMYVCVATDTWKRSPLSTW